jgi:predicted nucleic acid-binding protein
MNVLIDTNVVLDVLLKREPFFEDSSGIVFLSEKNVITGYVSASAATDLFYITRKEFQDIGKTYGALKNIFRTIRIAAVDEETVHTALDLEWKDFEDCIQYVSAKGFMPDYIITRNASDYCDGDITPISPTDFIERISGEQ